MSVLTTNGKANGWRATAVEEFRRIRTRWGIPAITQFSHYLGINYRTTTKLLSAAPKYPLKLETVLRAFSNLRVSVWLEFNTPEDVNNASCGGGKVRKAWQMYLNEHLDYDSLAGSTNLRICLSKGLFRADGNLSIGVLNLMKPLDVLRKKHIFAERFK